MPDGAEGAHLMYSQSQKQVNKYKIKTPRILAHIKTRLGVVDFKPHNSS